MSKFRICKWQGVWWLDCPNGVAMPCGSWHVARLRFKQELASWCPMCHRFAARPTDPITGWRECSKCGAEFNGSGPSSGRTTWHVYPNNDLIEHETDGDDCPCGPTLEPVFDSDGACGWVITHHSLDGRERNE